MTGAIASAKVAAAFLLGVVAIVVAGCATYQTGQQAEAPQVSQSNASNISEAIPKEGCNYNNPPCSEDYDCVNNTCSLKTGCSHDNPPCAASYDCINNSCVLKQGCKYNNPGCGLNSSCINNSCTPIGCKHSNPPCNSSQICQNNKCFEHILSSGGGGY
ncbi:hypothetical protein HYU16_04595 [Candidatus Woesearchaeota archaeon]|nr:hypothetical protein [Candidatus Woesearchaeota archaeon]